jgi:hypothetical protein
LLAIASFGMVMSSTFNAELHRRLLATDLPPTVAQSVESQRAKLAAIEPMSNARPETRVAIRRAVAESFIPGFRRIMLIAALLAFASAAGAWLMIGDARRAARTT